MNKSKPILLIKNIHTHIHKQYSYTYFRFTEDTKFLNKKLLAITLLNTSK